MRTIVLAAAVLVLAGCGTLGKLDTPATAQRSIADYDRVIVADLAVNDTRPAKDAAQAAQRAENIEAGRRAFATAIAEEIRKTGAFAEVAQAKMPAPALQVTGTIDLWEPGNIAARSLVGFVGKSEFSATVIISDLETNEELGRIVADRNSWPLPIGASTNVVQTVDFLMHQAAKRVAAELAKAKGVIVDESASAAATEPAASTEPAPPANPR